MTDRCKDITSNVCTPVWHSLQGCSSPFMPPSEGGVYVMEGGSLKWVLPVGPSCRAICMHAFLVKAPGTAMDLWPLEQYVLILLECIIVIIVKGPVKFFTGPNTVTYG